MASVAYVPTGSGKSEFSEKRSRFIGEAVPVVSREEAEAYIGRIREKYSDSSHVVYAFIVGPPKSMNMGMSDDGEPKGTAGKPVLEVLKGNGLTNVALTVVRYFGGTKLGTGGLVRAYARSAKETLEKVPIERYEVRVPFLFTITYDLYDPAKRIIETLKGRIREEDFGTAVMVSGEIPRKAVGALEQQIRDLSKGSVRLLYEKEE